MSKIGRKPIDITGVSVEVTEQTVVYKGEKSAGKYILPDIFKAELLDKELKISIKSEDSLTKKESLEVNRLWGLHRVLLANYILGAHKEFSVDVKIVGLGYKAVLSGKDKVVFSLGYSHKIDFVIPSGVSIAIDKQGQNIVLKSSNKCLVGQVASEMRALRPPEPYKGTGIRVGNEVVRRKAGKKAKSSA